MTAPSSLALLDQGNPALDSRAFRRCLGQFATGLTVVTAQSADGIAGVTVNSFASLSLEPPLVLWCINRHSASLPTFLTASHFVVNILAARQIHLSRHFSNPRATKFSGIPWSRGKSGSPILDDVVAYLECRRVAVHDGGDHVIMIGHVEHFARFEGEALLFVQGRYGVADDHPDAGAKAVSSIDAPKERESSLLMLLFRAYHSVSGAFQQHREAEGVTLAQGRVLAELYDNPGMTMDVLVRSAYLARRDAEDAVSDLVEFSYVSRDPGGSLTLTASGRARREAIAERAAVFEAERTAGLTDAKIACGRRFLEHLIRSEKTR